MGRLITLLAVAAVAVTAAFTVRALSEAPSRTASVVGADVPDATGTAVAGTDAGLDRLVLRADPRLTLVDGDRLAPGTRFRYSFRVTNASADPVGHVAVRSEAAGRGTDGRMPVLSVSDASCGRAGRVECIFSRLAPGETRTVQVVARTPPGYRPGDRLKIRTFLGRFTGTVGGSVPLQVVGGVRTTVGPAR